MDERLQRVEIENTLNAIQVRLNRADSSGDNWLLFNGSEWDRRVCEQNLRQAWLLLVDLITRLGHGPLLQFAETEFAHFSKDPTSSEMGPEEPFLVWPARAYSLLHMIRDIHAVEQRAVVPEPNIEHLLSLLRHSEYYITSNRAFGWVPSAEEDVHSRTEGLLKCTFSDTIHKPALAKPIKGFIPDTGIPSLRAAIEYKFIQSEADGRKALDQILADIGGYQSEAYDVFVFLLYETSRIFQEEEWKAAVAASKPRTRIEIVVIRGVAPSEADQKALESIREIRQKFAAGK